ncbi:MAG TPA: glycine oxidase ThiO [Vicinamibacteria bacterium]|nr:glycine oxidase ThiO [Vicinamibacteria bacterium]
MRSASSSDVIVIGAGVVGLSTARALAGRGARVLIVERRRVGAEASSAAAGMLSPQAESESDSPLLELGLKARSHIEALVPVLEGETGMALDYSSRGLIEVAFSEEQAGELQTRLAWQRARGLVVEPLSADDLRQAEPNLAPSARFGLLVPGDHRIDNVRLTRALAASAVARGAALLSGRPVLSLLAESGRVQGVRAGHEIHRAPVVVNAAGAWAGLLGGDPAPPPVEPIRGQIVAFDVAPPALRHVVVSPRGYLVPRGDGRILAGSTSERAGFDKSVTAAGLRGILDAAIEMTPFVADVPVADTWAGLRPGTPDGLPILGPGALPGLVHAAGLFRNGILLGPLVGEIAADLATGRAPGVDTTPFSPARFGAAAGA